MHSVGDMQGRVCPTGCSSRCGVHSAFGWLVSCFDESTPRRVVVPERLRASAARSSRRTCAAISRPDASSPQWPPENSPLGAKPKARYFFCSDMASCCGCRRVTCPSRRSLSPRPRLGGGNALLTSFAPLPLLCRPRGHSAGRCRERVPKKGTSGRRPAPRRSRSKNTARRSCATTR